MGRTYSYTALEDPRKLALLGLWSVPGLGAMGIRQIEADVAPLAELLDQRPAEWVGAVKRALTEKVKTRLRGLPRLADVAAEQRARVEARGMGVCFRGDGVYPELLAAVRLAPPLMFFLGPQEPVARRRLAIVGTRHPDGQANEVARRFAADAVASGIGVVSGAAMGVDQAAHDGAIAARGETWAVVASALDQLDGGPRAILEGTLANGGAFWSKYPPGVRANQDRFPQRNRYISGMSDAVLVIQAPARSGALITADFARSQRRPLLMVPWQPGNVCAAGSARYLDDGRAAACYSIRRACEAMGVAVQPRPGNEPASDPTVEWDELSPEARAAYEVLSRAGKTFEELYAASGVAPGKLTSALSELELWGLAVQRPGKLYERL